MREFLAEGDVSFIMQGALHDFRYLLTGLTESDDRKVIGSRGTIS